MEQLTLFNRNESYLKTMATLPKSKARVINALEKLGKASNREISEFLNLPVNSITGRCKELRQDEIVVEAGSKFDKVTNRNVTLFQIKY